MTIGFLRIVIGSSTMLAGPSEKPTWSERQTSIPTTSPLCRRLLHLAALEVIGTIVLLSLARAEPSEFVVFLPGMMFPAFGLALGTHLVIRD